MTSPANNSPSILVTEIEDLRKAAQEDFAAEVWGNWPAYLSQFNKLIEGTRQSGWTHGVEPLNPVPNEKLLHIMGIGGGSISEKAKLREIETSCVRLLRFSPETSSVKPKSDAISTMLRLFDRFHSIAVALRTRHAGRSTLNINDEYDIQDLIRALLTLHFDDIRPEEWTPNYAGSSKRMDFLLKREALVIELKMSRVGLGAKEAGDQLLVDIAHYGGHSDCEALLCLIYDPNHLIANPRGFESDLSKDHSGLPVIVLVRPK